MTQGMHLQLSGLKVSVVPDLAGGRFGVVYFRRDPLHKVGRHEIYDSLFEEISKDGRK